MSWLSVARGLGIGLIVIVCAAVAIWVAVNETSDRIRRIEIVQAFASVQRWADQNKLTIVSRQQVWDGTPFENEDRAIVFRVWVRDETGQERQGWVRCGKTPDVRWAAPDSPEPQSQV